MITIKRENASNDCFQLSDTPISIKNYVQFGNKRQNEHLYDYKQNKLKEIFINAKSKRIRQAFINKMIRRVSFLNNKILQSFENKQSQYDQQTEGFIYPEEFQHILQILNIVFYPMLIILSSFLGFLDDFSENFSTNQFVVAFKILCLTIALLRFFIKCTSVTFNKGQYKTYLKEILVAYFQSYRLPFDVVLIIIQLLALLFPKNMVIAALLFCYLNIMNIYPGYDTIRIQSAYIQSKRTALLWSLAKIIFFNLFFAHFMSTVILAMEKLDPENSWTVRAGINEKQWYIKYIYAYYWGTTIMMTVGFGDVLPGVQNIQQILVTTFLQLFSCIVLGYNISSIGNIVAQIRDSNESINRKIIIFQRMMRKDRKKNVKINPLLEKRISNYLQQLRIDKDNLFYVERDGLLSQLPENLRKAYFKEANKRIFPSVMFFNRLTSRTLQRLAERFKSQLYDHGDHLPQQQSILILEKGKVGYAYHKKGSRQNGLIFESVEVKQFEDTLLLNGTDFLEFLPEKRYDLIVKQNCIIWHLSKEELLDTLNLSIIDFQYYFSILHRHPLQQNQWEIRRCQRCENEYHSAFLCPRITYSPIRTLILHKVLFSQDDRENRRATTTNRKNYLSKINSLIWVKKLQQKQDKNKGMMSKSHFNPNSKSKREATDTNFTHFFSKISRKANKRGERIQKIDNFQIYNEQKLKRLIKEVLIQHETGYEEGYWLLESDQMFDYQFYFPQNNPNRLMGTEVELKSHSLKILLKKEEKIAKALIGHQKE